MGLVSCHFGVCDRFVSGVPPALVTGDSGQGPPPPFRPSSGSRVFTWLSAFHVGFRPPRPPCVFLPRLVQLWPWGRLSDRALCRERAVSPVFPVPQPRADRSPRSPAPPRGRAVCRDRGQGGSVLVAPGVPSP